MITGDLDYHTALDAEALGLAVIDAGHFATRKDHDWQDCLVFWTNCAVTVVELWEGKTRLDIDPNQVVNGSTQMHLRKTYSPGKRNLAAIKRCVELLERGQIYSAQG